MSEDVVYVFSDPARRRLGKHMGGGVVPVDSLAGPLLFCGCLGHDFVGFAGQDEFGACKARLFCCCIPRL